MGKSVFFSRRFSTIDFSRVKIHKPAIFQDSHERKSCYIFCIKFYFYALTSLIRYIYLFIHSYECGRNVRLPMISSVWAHLLTLTSRSTITSVQLENTSDMRVALDWYEPFVFLPYGDWRRTEQTAKKKSQASEICSRTVAETKSINGIIDQYNDAGFDGLIGIYDVFVN